MFLRSIAWTHAGYSVFRTWLLQTTGNFPESLRFCQKLTKVDIAYNLLEGSVPGGDARWINTMAILLLNNNKLSGESKVAARRCNKQSGRLFSQVRYEIILL